MRRAAAAGLESFSLRQPHLAHELYKARIRSQAVKNRFDLDQDQIRVALLIGLLEPHECLLFISEASVNKSNEIRRDILPLELAL